MFGSDAEFVDALVPFLTQAVAAGEPVFAAVPERRLAALRDRLGPGTEPIRFFASGKVEHPVRTLAGYHRYVADGLAQGATCVRLVGEPAWEEGSSWPPQDWVLLEAVLNAAFASVPAWLLCAYDVRRLPQGLLHQRARTHPQLLDADRVLDSPVYTDPAEVVREIDGHRPMPDPSLSTGSLFFQEELARMRRFVAEEAARTGVPADRRYELAVAANEIATNVFRYGDAVARVRLWTEGAEFVCEISDNGPGIRDPLAGYLPPRPGQLGRRGLWLARLLCDRVETRTDWTGTVVRLRMALEPRGGEGSGEDRGRADDRTDVI